MICNNLNSINQKRQLMKKVWSISTTVRNPERLRNFLITLKELENKEWNKEIQIEFQIRLIKNRFYGFGNSQFYNGLTQQQIDLVNNIKNHITMEEATQILETKNYVDVDMRGRTSYKPLEKMGLASIIDNKIKITPLGEYLLQDDYDLGDMFFKSFLKWQYPNPVDRDFKDNEIYNLKPFILTLHLINEVNNICRAKNIKAKGISKLEFEIFGQTLLNYINLKIQANSLVEFRLELEKIKHHKEKKDFTENYIDNFLSDFINIDYNNLRDYADNTIRYFRLTRFIYIRGGGYYIDLEPRRMIEINNLLNAYNGSSKIFTKMEYIKYISDINLPILPWEEKDKLIEIYTDLVNDISNLQCQLSQEIITFKTLDNVNSLKSEIKTLRQCRHKLQNLILKQELTDISKIDEVIDCLINIRKLYLKPSIALEKYITMALNIINDAKDIKANSLVGDDNEFIFTAPANKPDIECYYDNFNSICEVTMLSGRNQWHNEGQPVMRHFRDFEDNSSLNANYCLFVAPKLHRDTINTFWFSVKYEYEGVKQKIVPFTITQIIEILRVIKKLKENDKLFSHLQFKKLLDNIINLKNNVDNSDDWLRDIPNTILSFKKEVLCN
jgi:hypothetical protein